VNAKNRLRLLRQGTIKRLHVDKRVITRNRTHGTQDPPITVQTSAGSLKAFEASWDGPSKMMYSPDKPLGCGARLWIETRAKVTIK